MKTKKYSFCGLILALVLCFSATTLASSTSENDEQAVKSIAQILSHINHFPSAAEKKTLQKIADDSQTSDHVRTIANAMIHMSHSVDKADKEKLKHIGHDANADDDIKEIAKILIHFNHKPSGGDVKKLQEIMD